MNNGKIYLSVKENLILGPYVVVFLKRFQLLASNQDPLILISYI